MKIINFKRYLTRKNIILGVSALLVLLIILVFVVKPQSVEVASFAVTRGPFIISINQGGEILAKNSVSVIAPQDVRGNLTIVYLAEEGSRVKKGDILIMFDTSDLDARIEEREASYLQQIENIEKLEAGQSSTMSSLMSALEVTKNNFELSKLRLQQMEFEADTRKQMEELSYKNSQINLKKQEENIKNQKIIQGVDLKNVQMRIDRSKRFLDETKAEREKLIMRAPMDGLVVYKENMRSTNREKVKVGDTPHRRMPLIELPDLSVMEVKTAVNEIDIQKVERGQKAIIRLDAVQDVSFTGDVTDVAYLARRESGSNVKVFDVIITIDEGENPLLKPGMSATVEIVTEQMDDEIYIALESVFEKDGKTIAYVHAASWEEREISVGKSNSNYIIVEEGLEVGDMVALRDPTVELEQFGAEIKTPTQKTQNGQSGTGAQQPNIQMIREMMMRSGGGGGGSPGGRSPGGRDRR
ncbi:HlyD family secretion protein [candidate division KSB1 bacterium]